jgi:hypothetical protein
MSGCIKKFNTTVLEEQSVDNGYLKVRFDWTKSDGSVHSDIREYNYSDISYSYSDLSNDVTAFFSDNEWCTIDEEGNNSDMPELESDGLLGLLKQKNELIKNQNDLLKKQNEILISGNKSNATAVAINAQTEVSKTYYNKATSKNISQNSINQFGLNGDENIRNSNGDKIIPIHEKAKKDSEKAIETSNMNNTDLTKVLDIFDDVDENSNDLSDDNNLFSILENVFTLPSDYEIPENLKEKDL